MSDTPRDRTREHLARLARMTVVALAPVTHGACDTAPEPFSCADVDSSVWKGYASAGVERLSTGTVVLELGTDWVLDLAFDPSSISATGATVVDVTEGPSPGSLRVSLTPDDETTRIVVTGTLHCVDEGVLWTSTIDVSDTGSDPTVVFE